MVKMALKATVDGYTMTLASLAENPKNSELTQRLIRRLKWPQ